MSRRIAVAQMTCTSSVEENLRQATDFIQQARLNNASFVCLPESFDYMVDDPTHALSLASPLHSNPILSRYHNLASQSDLWLSLGGMHVLSPHDPSRIHNVHLILSPHDPTTPVAAYRKTHLDVSSSKIAESHSTLAGDSLVVAYDTPVGNVGLTVGSDLFFPSVFSALREANAHILLTPSAFMPSVIGNPGNGASNGTSRWETLLKARAMDNQCYVVGAAQVGMHSYERESWGQSMVVGPIGECIVDAGRMGPCMAYADVNLDMVHQVRERMPIRKLRRDDLLGKIPRAGPV